MTWTSFWTNNWAVKLASTVPAMRDRNKQHRAQMNSQHIVLASKHQACLC